MTAPTEPADPELQPATDEELVEWVESLNPMIPARWPDSP